MNIAEDLSHRTLATPSREPALEIRSGMVPEPVRWLPDDASMPKATKPGDPNSPEEVSKRMERTRGVCCYEEISLPELPISEER